ncbi:MAG TPA: hypothetical protein VG267_15985 [Terracidiphilus sp.]|jgi:uncharacterized protein YjbI with pentapeptide repeats|nr:hypothetical protein [Terracidiphilus sp.]
MADEQHTTFEKSAVAEPEIEPGEGSEEEPEREPDENTEWEGEYGESGCPVGMVEYPEVRCGRKLHVTPEGMDEYPVCLMHSKDPNKRSGPLFEAFRREFERILIKAGGSEAHFEKFVFPPLDFSRREFQAICLFSGATFTQSASFFDATFMQKVDFDFVTFIQDADFAFATLTQNADFSGATFTQATNYSCAKFHGTVDWSSCRFLAQTEFVNTTFDPQIVGKPSAVFDGANFFKPSEIVFDDVDLSRALFHNCDVSQVSFTSSVRWGIRGNNRGLAVFEETIPLEQLHTVTLKRDGRRDYRAVAQIYQQLKKNYDVRLDYWTANEFHFGEMEMKRLAVPTVGPLLWLRKWFHRKLSLVALYKHASDYGNSYGKPMLWLLGILALFAALLPLPGVGLKRQGAGQAETYATVWRAGDGWMANLRAEARLGGKGAITSVDAATFQKSAEYAPVYPWGRVLAIFETLLTSTLFALFLLAIRRQFRR